jgi:uncharacterized protein (TIGR01777 family)
MKLLITGATGLVGSALRRALTQHRHEVWSLGRKANPNDARALVWNPDHNQIPTEALEGFDAVIHLAGDNIAEGRWTDDKKRRIRDSRVVSTRLLVETLLQLKQPPKTLLSASAVGIYGSRGDELLTETSTAGNDFLAKVGGEWEAASQPAAQSGMRVVHLRFGIILSPLGGALAKMLPIFKLGGGGVVGSGAQYWAWISLDDVLGAIEHALFTPALHGPINVVAPETVTNREFTATLARVLGRPAFVPVPAFAARLAFGEMADATLLASQRVQPAKLLATRYEFKHPTLEVALRELLKAPATP